MLETVAYGLSFLPVVTMDRLYMASGHKPIYSFVMNIVHPGVVDNIDQPSA